MFKNPSLYRKHLVFFMLCLVTTTTTVFSQQYRYIRLQKSGTNTGGNIINLAEIQVIDIEGVNRALAGTATLSSTYVDGGIASVGNDGDTNGNWFLGTVFASSATGANEWWEIDLGDSYDLTTINIYNRTDGVQERLSNMYVMASNTPFDTTGADGTNLTAAFANAGFTHQFGEITDADPQKQVVTLPVSTPKITTSISSTNFCAGSQVTVGFTSQGPFYSGNTSRIYLSDASGNFSNSPTVLLTKDHTDGATVIRTVSSTVIIPANLPYGTGYRIRTVSSNPYYNGPTNGVDITINAKPAAPIVGTITQPTCITATGSVALSGLPATGTWTLTRSPDNITTPGTGTTTTITGLSAGTYTYTVTNASGCTSAASTSIVINQQPATPAAPIVTVKTQSSCSFEGGVVTVSNLPSGSWTLTRSPGNFNRTGSTSTIDLTVTPGTHTYTVRNSEGCTSIASAPVTINATGRPSLISGNGTPCYYSAPASPSTETYSVLNDAGVTNYNWAIPSNWTITSGQGTHTITVEIGSDSGDITVDADGNCQSVMTVITHTLDTDLDGIPNACDDDDDNDGVLDLNDEDDDNDGITDLEENDFQMTEVHYEYYDTTPTGDTVDNIPTTGFVGYGVLSDFDVKLLQTRHDPTSDDVRDEDYFSIRYTGNIRIATAGDYTFYTNSNDGTKLFIDKGAGWQTVVNNDGTHIPVEESGTINLAVGVYPVKIEYFQRAGTVLLEAFYEGPGIAKQNLLGLVDTDNDGIPNYVDNDSDNDGCPDAMEGSLTSIATTDLNDLGQITTGGINGTTGIPNLVGSGQTDVSSTNPLVLGSCASTALNFIGTTNDYIGLGDNFNFTSSFSIEAWVLKSTGSPSFQIIISKGDRSDLVPQKGYYLHLDNNKPRFFWYDNSGTDNRIINLQNSTGLGNIDENKWYHLAVTFDGSIAKLYVDGLVIATDNVTDPLTNTTENFIIGGMYRSNYPTTPRNNFDGYIDEVRIWDTALTETQLHEMMNQRIEENATTNNVKGQIIPLDISEPLPWSNLKGYYPFNNGYTALDQSGNNNHGIVYNMTSNQPATAPLPYVSTASGDWDTSSTWLNGDVQNLPNSIRSSGAPPAPPVPVDWNIVKISTGTNVDLNRGDGNGVTLLGLISEANSTLNVTGTTDITTGTGTGQYISVSGYLKLATEGIIHLKGESQLLQSEGSILDATSSGYITRSQQGTANLYSYNYWGSPVGKNLISGTNSYNYKLQDVLYADLTTPVVYLGGNNYNGKASPLTIANYWIWKFANKAAGVYAEWQHMRSTGDILAGEGFTMKGTENTDVSNFQNYVFRGLPNNGDITLNVSANNEYLVANPYPSAINIINFFNDNLSIIQDGYIYFWEQFDVRSHILSDYEGVYWLMNKSGAVQSAVPSLINQNLDPNDSNKTPNNNIPVAQGFFIEAQTDTPIQFKNSQRVFVTESSGDAVFMKQGNSKSKIANNKKEDTRKKIRLGFKAPKLNHRQLLLTIDERATDAVDWGFDGKMDDVLADDMYWDLADKKYVIQALPDANIDREIPLGLIMSKTGLATIQIDALENVDESVELYIKDALIGKTYKINNQAFEIELEAGVYKDRFALTFAPQEVLDIEDEILKNGIVVHMNNASSTLEIKNMVQAEITQINLYNAIGQILNVWDKNLQNQNLSLPVYNTTTGMYLVQIKTTTGTISKKVIIK
ncbi:T9SS C-terminal target domain-containing protein [Lutibacter sp. HS1-25]|uniref:LamG-like jellyroll fold domain-containing protein n=1 Tax=Lutibacter sp. HS1-25 TaxID=2485000 RepID=UPI00101041C0|nr:LamG-like jellyroll fold domain-containing protein [Lutibacter sp. HS1-25]RXP49319.1 T9SS C-terminal target domain-containing protein [Lutibacter sp. HS1-25]